MDYINFFEQPAPKISVSVPKIACEVYAGHTGFFEIKNIGRGVLTGHVFSKSSVIRFACEDFRGNDIRVDYTIDVSGRMAGELIRTSAYVITNGGEHVLPVIIRVLPPMLVIENDGDAEQTRLAPEDDPALRIGQNETLHITKLKEFARYAKRNPAHAKNIIGSQEFADWLTRINYAHMAAYEALLRDNNRERALHNFLVLNKLKKQEMIAAPPPPITANLSKDILTQADKAFIIIKNNTEDPLAIQLSSSDTCIQFESADVSVPPHITVRVPFYAKIKRLQTAGFAVKRKTSVRAVISLGLQDSDYIERFDVIIALGGFLARLGAGTQNGRYIEKTISAYMKDYTENPTLELLTKIAEGLAERFDYSKDALIFYKEAARAQIPSPVIEAAYLRALYVNNDAAVPYYVITNFLKTEVSDFNLKTFIYHLIVTDSKFKELALLKSDDITAHAKTGLNENNSGGYFYSIYAYALKNAVRRRSLDPAGADADFTDAEINRLTELLYPNLFVYEADAPKNIETLWLFDREKREHTVFTALETSFSRRIKIKSVSLNQNYLTFDKTGKNIVPIELMFRKAVQNADMELYRYFLEIYQGDTDLIIIMSRFFLDGSDGSEFAVQTLTKLLAIKEAAYGLRARAGAFLGNLLASSKDYKKAAVYFTDCDERFINDKFTERMLDVFIKTNELDKAARLITEKSHLISENGLLAAFTALAAHEKYHAEIANVGYDLILKSHCDAALIEIVLKHYKGLHDDYLSLAMALYRMQIDDLDLSVKILENCLSLRKSDKQSRQIFVSLFNTPPKIPVIEPFACLLIYELLAENIKIELSCLDVLEQLFLAGFPEPSRKLLAYALLVAYEKTGETSRSDEIKKHADRFMREDDLFFPSGSKITKYRSFTYRSQPGRDVYLIYVSDGKAYQKKMTYLRFGLYLCHIPVFFNERLIYFFREQMRFGNVETARENLTGIFDEISETEDDYHTLNNALIYEHIGRFSEVEKIISAKTQTPRMIKATLPG